MRTVSYYPPIWSVPLWPGLILVLFTGMTPSCKGQATERISVASRSRDFAVDASSSAPALSADGRYIAFVSLASNIVQGSGQQQYHIYVKDRQTGIIERISTAQNGTEGNGPSVHPTISADGRFVAFESEATNFVPGDTNAIFTFPNGCSDVFVKDRLTGAIERVSTASDGMQANQNSGAAAISADGRFVAFASAASNLVTGDTNRLQENAHTGVDVFVKDRLTGAIERVSTASDGSEGNNNSGNRVNPISAEGRYVAFASGASNLVPGDTEECVDIFVKDRLTGTIERVSTASNGSPANLSCFDPSLSADGRYVAFISRASNLVHGDTNQTRDSLNTGVDVFVKDRLTGILERVSTSNNGTQANANCNVPVISGNGRYVAFRSIASNLIEGDTNGIKNMPNSGSDIFVKDRQTGIIERVSVSSNGTQSNYDTTFYGLSLSAEGRYVAFESAASNLVPGDTEGWIDVFIRGPLHATNYVTLTGKLTLEEISSFAGMQLINFALRSQSGSGDAYQSAFVNPDGHFTLSGVPADTYLLHIDSFQYLSSHLFVDAFSGSVSGITDMLKAGDANDDDSVDVLDLDFLIQSFDATEDSPHWNAGRADFNRDGVVDVSDLSLLIRNFDTSGEP